MSFWSASLSPMKEVESLVCKQSCCITHKQAMSALVLLNACLHSYLTLFKLDERGQTLMCQSRSNLCPLGKPRQLQIRGLAGLGPSQESTCCFRLPTPRG